MIPCAVGYGQIFVVLFIFAIPFLLICRLLWRAGNKKD